MTRIMLFSVLFCISANGLAAEKVEMKVTAYCCCEICCGKNAVGLTSTGKDARNTSGVAADPKLLPYGTVLDIPGVGTLVVDDTGGAMRQDAKKGVYHIDIRMNSHAEALKFGVKNLQVTVHPKGHQR